MLKISLILTALLTLLAGCGEKGNSNDPPLDNLCPSIAAITSIKIEFEPSEKLPPFLAIAINGSKIDHDECNKETNGYYIKDLDNGNLEIKIHQNTDDFKKYANNGISAQDVDEIDFTLFGRTNCEEEREVLSRKTKQKLTWKAINSSCPDQGHNGFAKITQ